MPAGQKSLNLENLHRNVSGGWLRPAVFGAMDGLVSNFALMIGVAGGTQAAGVESTKAIVLAGFAGLLAGAFSMAAGEYTSVASQAELGIAEIELEKKEIKEDLNREIEELAQVYVARGVSHETALKFSQELSKNENEFIDAHSLEEFGVSTKELPSAKLAAVSSFISFGLGAMVPLLPFLFGFNNLVYSLVVSLIGLFLAGAVVSLVTTRTWWYSGTRQLLIGSGAAAITWILGNSIGSVL